MASRETLIYSKFVLLSLSFTSMNIENEPSSPQYTYLEVQN
jgi:hypothetical protein